LDMCKVSLPSLCIIKRPKAEFTGNQLVRRPGFKWEEGVKEDALRFPQFRNCKLAAQNGTVLRQKLWEAKCFLQGVVL